VKKLGISKDEKGLNKNTGKFLFRDFLAKTENKKIMLSIFKLK